MDNRAVTPVVEKMLTIGIVMLFVSGMTATLFGSAVPTYRGAVGQEMSERVLAQATAQVERAVPPNGTAVNSSRAVDLPATIEGSGYAIRTDGRTLVLDHPDEAVTERSRPVLPSSVTSLSGEWSSGGDAVVSTRSVSGGLAIELREGPA